MTRGDRERAAWSLRAVIQVVAREVFGAPVVTRHVPGLSTPLQDVEPIAGVRAAVFAQDVAAAAVRNYAKQARGAGHSWDDLAQGLGADRSTARGPGRSGLIWTWRRRTGGAPRAVRWSPTGARLRPHRMPTKRVTPPGAPGMRRRSPPTGRATTNDRH